MFAGQLHKSLDVEAVSSRKLNMAHADDRRTVINKTRQALERERCRVFASGNKPYFGPCLLGYTEPREGGAWELKVD